MSSNPIAKPVSKNAPDENPLFKVEVMNAFCEGLSETLHTMAQADIVFGSPEIRTVWQSLGEVTGCIHFDTTDFKGSIYINLSEKVLIQIYNAMVGETSTEATPEVYDCIGEISNMAYGVAKGKLDPLHFQFSMSLPQTTKTKDLGRMNAPHLVIPFSIHKEDCAVEITLVKK